LKKRIEKGGRINEFGSIAQELAYTRDEIFAFITGMPALTISGINKYSQHPSLYEPAYNPMNAYEKSVALLLISKGLMVYREIPIGTNGSNADFYVYNPKSKKGKLVEVTLIKKAYKPREKLPSHKTRKRKSNQLLLLKATGMPFVVLYKENLESIRKYVDLHLF
jgi:hypothetical protein